MEGLTFTQRDYRIAVAGLEPDAPSASEADRDLWHGIVWLFEEVGDAFGAAPEQIAAISFVDRDHVTAEVLQ